MLEDFVRETYITTLECLLVLLSASWPILIGVTGLRGICSRKPVLLGGRWLFVLVTVGVLIFVYLQIVSWVSCESEDGSIDGADQVRAFAILIVLFTWLMFSGLLRKTMLVAVSRAQASELCSLIPVVTGEEADEAMEATVRECSYFMGLAMLNVHQKDSGWLLPRIQVMSLRLWGYCLCGFMVLYGTCCFVVLYFIISNFG